MFPAPLAAWIAAFLLLSPQHIAGDPTCAQLAAHLGARQVGDHALGQVRWNREADALVAACLGVSIRIAKRVNTSMRLPWM